MRDQNTEYFNTDTAARYSGLSRRTLAAWRKTDDGPPYCRFGVAVRYAKRDLNEWAAKSRVRTSGAAA
jgi:hypothetical protein